jgi:hypothetical protein
MAQQVRREGQAVEPKQGLAPHECLFTNSISYCKTLPFPPSPRSRVLANVAITAKPKGLLGLTKREEKDGRRSAMPLVLATADDLQGPWTWRWRSTAKRRWGTAGRSKKPSGHDDGNVDDPGGNERMAKTSVSFAGQLRGPALAGGEVAVAEALGLGMALFGVLCRCNRQYVVIPT